jgi:hypothetical protein
VVLIVKVEVTELPPLGVSVDGEAVQVAAAGKPLQASVTWALNPNSGFTVTVRLAEFPAASVTVGGVTVKPKPEGWSTPVPVSRIIWGLSGALSVRVRESTLGPDTVGVKVTPISQFDAGVVAWRGTAQPLVWTAKPPLAIALVIFNAAVPVFVTVRNWGELVVLTP